MPYAQNFYLYPAPGKTPEVRRLLEDRVRSAQQHDERSSLRQQVWFDEGVVLSVSTLHDSLAAFERSRDRNLSDPATAELLQRLSQLTRRPARLELFESLLPGGGAAPAAPPRYYGRAIHFPAPGKAAEMRSVLTEHVESRRAAGARMALLSQVFAPKGITFVVGAPFTDLAEVEQRRKDGAAALAALSARLGPLSRDVVHFELHEVLVPFPA